MSVRDTPAVGTMSDDMPPAGVQSVAKAVRILRAFDGGRRFLTVRDLAQRTGLPRSTCHAICSTLVTEGLLEQLDSGGYQLGSSLVSMGGQVIDRVGLATAAAPFIHLLEGFGTVHLAQCIGGHVVHLAYSGVDPTRTHTVNQLGRPVPVYRSSCGRAALAQMAPTKAYELLVNNGVSQSDATRLVAHSANIQSRGFTVSVAGRGHSLSVGSAVTDHGGTVLGVLAIAASSGNLTSEKITALGTAVRGAAARVSAELQHRQLLTVDRREKPRSTG